MVLTALTLARDEIFWLFKHNSMPPPKGKHRPNPEDYNDPALPELIYLIVELKGVYRNKSICILYVVYIYVIYLPGIE